MRSCRGRVETGKLALSTEYRDGKVRVTVDARDDRNRPLTDLRFQSFVTPPNQQPGDNKAIELKFEQKNSGQYEAEFKAEEAGSYFINAKALRTTMQMRNGRPVVLILSHIGNWELQAQMLPAAIGYVRNSTIYQPLKNRYIDKHVRALRGRRRFPCGSECRSSVATPHGSWNVGTRKSAAWTS